MIGPGFVPIGAHTFSTLCDIVVDDLFVLRF